VGNIFKLKYKYSEPLGLKFVDETNKQQIVYMGCYGIGISRLMGVIAEKFADERGLVWPETVAPYRYHLIGIGENGLAEAEKFYNGREDLVLFDDRNRRPGEKFADADLMGLPIRVVVSDRTLEADEAEITDRKTGESWRVRLEELFEKF
jgi:prolyl-tRNA synthetase